MKQCMDADNLHRRLKKIIGQVQAIDRMIDEDVPCEDVLSQINAAKSALHGCGKSEMVLNTAMPTRPSKISQKRSSGSPTWDKSFEKAAPKGCFFLDSIYPYGYNIHIPPNV